MSDRPPGAAPTYGSAVRMAQIVLWLHRAPIGLTYAELQQRLGISERTLARYVQTLKTAFVDDHGVPMFEVTRSAAGPRLQFSRKPLSIGGTAMELMGLFVAMELMKFLEGTLFSKGSEQMIDRICNALLHAQGHRVQLILKDFHRKFFHWTEAPKTYQKHDPILRDIVEALIFQRICAFTYQSPGKPLREHRLHPLTLLMYKRGLYLVGRKTITPQAPDLTFAVERIQRFTVLDEGFAYPNDYAPDKRFIHGFGLVQHETTDCVHLRFAPLVADGVASRRWHPSQRVEFLESGELDVHLELEIGTEFLSWIQSYGPFVKVLHPPQLVARVMNAARQTLDLYDSHVAKS